MMQPIRRPHVLRIALAVMLIATALPAHAQPSAAPPAERAVDPAQVPDAALNLLPNGTFDQVSETGDGPAHWQAIDNLVFFWQEDPADSERGKVMRIDTDVRQQQAYQWWIDRFVHEHALEDAPAKQPTVAPRYDTVAGLTGGFYWSDYIEIKPGGAYRVYVDAKGPASMVFVRGYEKMLPLSFGDETPAVQQQFREPRGEPLVDENGRPVRYRLRYSYTTRFPVGGSNEWQTYTHVQPRHPNSLEITENVRYIRVMLYPFWPPGDYWYDNVRVVEVEPDADAARPDADEADVEEGKVVR